MKYFWFGFKKCLKKSLLFSKNKCWSCKFDNICFSSKVSYISIMCEDALMSGLGQKC